MVRHASQPANAPPVRLDMRPMFANGTKTNKQRVNWRPPCAEGKIQFGFVPANVELGKPVGSGPGGKLVVVEVVMY
jgi:hypothetical protein